MSALVRLRAALTRLLSEHQLTEAPEHLERYSVDESGAAASRPNMVVFAESAADVQSVLRWCSELRVPVTPVGARTGKSGGSIPVFGGVALSLERMTQVTSIDVANRNMVVEPGVITGTVRRVATEHGLYYPPDPNSLDSCTIGGNVAENAGGPTAQRYGVTRDYVLQLEWVLPSGELITVGRQTAKGVAGLDLVSLLVGSEGMLGVATQIRLRLVAPPPSVVTIFAQYTSLAAALRAFEESQRMAATAAATELFDQTLVEALRPNVLLSDRAQAAVLYEFHEATDEAALGAAARVGELNEGGLACAPIVAQHSLQRQQLWALRRGASWALRARCARKMSEDIVVPRTKIAEAIARFHDIGRDLGLGVATYGHLGDGNLHVNLLAATMADADAFGEALNRVVDVALACGGTITGEHGVGILKSAHLQREQSLGVRRLQEALRRAFDPYGIMNPGKQF